MKKVKSDMVAVVFDAAIEVVWKGFTSQKMILDGD